MKYLWPPSSIEAAVLPAKRVCTTAGHLRRVSSWLGIGWFGVRYSHHGECTTLTSLPEKCLSWAEIIDYLITGTSWSTSRSFDMARSIPFARHYFMPSYQNL
ncbi:hypothetical protein ACMFMG_005104 [Clarireedia jacksonii]